MENITNFRYRDNFYDKTSVASPRVEKPEDILSKQMQYWN